MPRKKSLKNGKHLVDLLDSAMVPAIRMLATIDKFAFLPIPTAALPDADIRAQLVAALAEADPIALAVADQEAMRVLDLARFRTEHLLSRARDALEFEGHPELDTFDPRADAITRLIWLRAKASRIFDQVETAYLTHHFHGHAKFHTFGVKGGQAQAFVWSDEVESRLHAAVTQELALSDEDKAGCEIIHFEMADGDEEQPKLLHYLVVYHPGKMRTQRQMLQGRRDLLAFNNRGQTTVYLGFDPCPSASEQLRHP